MFLLSDPSRLYTALTGFWPCVYSMVSVFTSCVAVNSWPNPPPPPRPPPRPPPPPPAGGAGTDAGSSVHLPAKFGLACAASDAVVAIVARAMRIAVMRFMSSLLVGRKAEGHGPKQILSKKRARESFDPRARRRFEVRSWTFELRSSVCYAFL